MKGKREIYENKVDTLLMVGIRGKSIYYKW